MFYFKILLFTSSLHLSASFSEELKIALKVEDLGVCGKIPELASSNRNFLPKKNRNFLLKKDRNRNFSLDLSFLNTTLEKMDVRIVGGADVKEHIPW